MSYQNTPTSNDEDETAVLLGTTLTSPTTPATGFRWNQRVTVVAGMLMMLVVAGGAVLLFATMGGGRTMMSAAESAVVATEKSDYYRECLSHCATECKLACIEREYHGCEYDCEHGQGKQNCQHICMH